MKKRTSTIALIILGMMAIKQFILISKDQPSGMQALIFFTMITIIYISSAVIIGRLASKKYNRPGIGWFLLSIAITPIFAFLILSKIGKFDDIAKKKYFNE